MNEKKVENNKKSIDDKEGEFIEERVDEEGQEEKELEWIHVLRINEQLLKP